MFNAFVDDGTGSEDMFADMPLGDTPIKRQNISQLNTIHVSEGSNASSTQPNKRRKSSKPPSLDEIGPKKTTRKTTKRLKSSQKGKKGRFNVAYTNKKAAKLLSESGNNELSREALSILSEEEKLLLSSWGLPKAILAKYRKKGLDSLFQWQLDCLSNERVLEGCNLLYSAPTSAGKTLVAEILMIKRVLELGKKAIMILPFVSVAREKMYSLQDLFGGAGVRVEGFMGSYCPPGGFKSVDIAICTIEKANSLVNRLLEEGSLNQVGTIVVDEIHLLGDPHRGYLLELLLTKIRFMMLKSENALADISNVPDEERTRKLSIQIVGMSATLPNLDLLANWLNAELVTTEFRPVPLVERIKIGDNIYDEQMRLVRPVLQKSLDITIEDDPDNLIYLCLETVLDGHSILIFCPTKKMCEQTAVNIAKEFYRIGNPMSTHYPEIGEKLRRQLMGYKIADVIAQLDQCPAGLDDTLEKSVAFGVAFHHAGLTYDERDILEASFKNGVLRVMVATSTLSAGVNLPARRVIIRTPNFNGGILDVLTYRQMSGRAGRKGVDSAGESVLICSKANQATGIRLIQSSLPHVKSALLEHHGSLTSAMKRAMLEVIASGVAQTPSQVLEYSKCTLLSRTLEIESARDDVEMDYSLLDDEEAIQECLKFLVENEFIRLKKFESLGRSDEYMATQLGSACLASSLSPDEGISVFKELQKARQCFVLENELHVVYQVTPIYLAEQWRNIDWNNFLALWDSLSSDEKKVANLVGVEENFIVRAMMGTVSRRNPKQAEQLSIHQRFFTSLALNDLVNEISIGEVAEKYCVNKGVIQNLQQAASTFAGMVTVFCNRLSWFNLELLLSQFQERLQFGVQRELCDLVRLSLVNGQRARVIYDAGLKTIAELAACEPAQLEHILHKAGPFNSAVHGQATKPLWIMGKSEGLGEGEAARLIVDEARQFLQIELNLPTTMDYNTKNASSPLILSHTSNKNGNISSESEDESSENGSPDDNYENGNLSQEKASHGQDQEPELRVSEIGGSPCTRQTQINSESLNGQSADAQLERSGCKSPEMNVFEDSFPIDLIMSQLDKNPNGHFQIPVKEDLQRTMGNSPSTDQKHSTPLQNICLANLAENEHFRQSVDEMSFCSNGENEIMNTREAADMSDILMTSLTSQMEFSLNISERESPKPANPVNEVIPMSEDMFAQDDIKTSPGNKVSNGTADNVSASASSIDIFETSLENLENQRPQKSRKPSGSSRNSEEYDQFDNDFARREVLQRRQSFQPATIRGRTLQIKAVDNPELIPIKHFTPNQIVGIGINFKAPKRIRSLSRNGIGSRITAGHTQSHSVQKKPGRSLLESDPDNWIAVFDEMPGIIWLFRWAHKELNSPRNGIKGMVARIFLRIKNSGAKIALLQAKEKLKTLYEFCGKEFTMFSIIPTACETSMIWDPAIADWLVECNDRASSLTEMVSTYLANEVETISKLNWPAEIVESYWSTKLMTILKEKLEKSNLWKHFTDVEMPAVKPLLLMEMNGFGLNSSELEGLKKQLDYRAAVLELRAFYLAGRQFNLSSPKEIRQILFREIGLKEPQARGTAKDVLVKLNHELPPVIIEWRKVVNAIKMVIHFMQDRNLDTGRVHGCYSHFTISGRVIMKEPSLQCIPRDFDLKIALSVQEIKSIRENSRIKFGSKVSSLLSKVENGNAIRNEGIVANGISMRNSFVPCSPAFLLMSADYAQLELRILAHLCDDENLLRVLNVETGVDVFKCVAAQWKKLHVTEVTAEMRQEAKTVTYGIIYGMGSNSLAEQLDIEEEMAGQIISEFMRAYPKIRSFIDSTVNSCREHGFVQTIRGRKRLLPNITSKQNADRAQAERQAVNFRIQGSASDLVKLAMSQIYSNLACYFPDTVDPVSWKKRSFGRSKSLSLSFMNSTVCFPILNLHDELIFEVNESHLSQIANIVKFNMENCLKLNVSLPVVINTGKTWGTMSQYFVT